MKNALRCILLLSAAGFGAFAGPPAFAQAPAKPAAPSCFARAYDAAHLARNPDQRTERIRISFSDEVIPGSRNTPVQNFIRIEVTRRGESPLRAIGGCEASASANRGVDGRKLIPAFPKEAGIVCVIAGQGLDSEGGLVLLDPAGATLQAYFDEDGMVMRRGREISKDKGRWVRFGRADQVFRLTREEPAACDKLRAAVSFE